MLCSVYKVYTVVKGQNQYMHEIEMSMHYFEIIRPGEARDRSNNDNFLYKLWITLKFAFIMYSEKRAVLSYV